MIINNLLKQRMSSTTDRVYAKLNTVAKTVKEGLKRKGIAIPVKNSNGTVSLENYTISKQVSGFYSILDRHGDIIIDQINLPQSAALLANNLALGKWIDPTIRGLDTEYGYRSFEYELFKKNANQSLKNKNIDRAEMLFTRCEIAKSRVELAKKQIIASFEKLRNLR
jgi:hypothetical protein